MAGVSKLTIEIIGDAKKAVSAFKEAGDGAEGLGSKLGGVGKVVGGALLGVAGVAAGFAEHSLSVFENTAKGVRTLQRLTGDTAENMSRLSFAAEEVGISNESLEGGMKKLSKAVEGNNKAFDQYGIATKDAQGKMLGMNDIIQNAAEVFKNMPNGIEKNALAMKLFGKSGTDLIPLLNQGKDGLVKFGEEADKFGITIGQKQVDAMAKNARNSKEMHAALKGLEIQVGEKLMPVVTKLTTWMVAHLPQALAFVKKAVEAVTPVFQAMGNAIADVVTWVKDHWDQISTIVSNVVGYITGTVSTFVAVFEGIWSTFGNAITTYIGGVWDLIKGIFQAAIDVIVGIFDFFRDLFTGKWGKLWGDVQQILTGVWEAISAYISYTLTTIEAVLQAAWDAVKLVASAAWDGIKAVVSGVWDAIVGAITAYINTIKAGLSAAWDGIKAVASAAWDGIKLAITAPIDAVSGALGAVWDTVKSAASAAWDGIKAAADTAWNAVKDAVMAPIHAMKDAIGTVWDDVIGAITGLPGRIASAAAGMWNGIKDGFKSVINAIIGWWNGLHFPSFHIPQITIPMPPGISDWHIGGEEIGGWGFPSIPTLHTGGIVPGALGTDQLTKLQAGEGVFTRDQMAAMGGGGAVYNITNHIHMPIGSSGDDMISAIKKWERRNGPGWRQ